jgi:hypothetical protein
MRPRLTTRADLALRLMLVSACAASASAAETQSDPASVPELPPIELPALPTVPPQAADVARAALEDSLDQAEAAVTRPPSHGTSLGPAIKPTLPHLAASAPTSPTTTTTVVNPTPVAPK